MGALPPVRLADPGGGYRADRAAIDAAFGRVVDSGWYILGPSVAAFEESFARYVGVGHCVGVANGTDALALALKGVGVKPGDRVVTVSHTAVATVAAVEIAGAVPVLLDIDPASYCLSADRFDDYLAAHEPPAAVVAVHLYGHPAPLDRIVGAARRHGVKVVEDCAQAVGSALNGTKTGAWGDAASFSFYPTKNLGALGDGGAVVTGDPAVAERVKSLRQYGWDATRQSRIPGVNSRLDEVQAALLSVRLERLEAENDRRRAIARRYDAVLAGSSVAPPAVAPGGVHSYHQYVVRLDRRDSFRSFMTERGIETLVHYPLAAHQQAAYAGRLGTFPEGAPATTKAVGEIVSLPVHPYLTDADVARVEDALREWLSR